jgi:hypothetical protein
MDETKWLASEVLETMLEHLGFGASRPRKLRLFATACLRRSNTIMGNDLNRAVVLAAESYADQQCSLDHLRQARQAAFATWFYTYSETDGLDGDNPIDVARHAASEIRRERAEAARQTNDIVDEAASEAIAAENCCQVTILRDIFANPFRPVTLDPVWRDHTVVSLARAAYDKHIFPYGELESDRLAVLSDALEEAGCDDSIILAHLRAPGPHIRGCWALDSILEYS